LELIELDIKRPAFKEILKPLYDEIGEHKELERKMYILFDLKDEQNQQNEKTINLLNEKNHRQLNELTHYRKKITAFQTEMFSLNKKNK